MTLLPDTEIRRLLKNMPPLAENLIDENIQVQPDGLELTVREVQELSGCGAVDFDNSCRQTPSGIPVGFDEDGWVFLSPGIYRLLLNEIVHIPPDLAAVARPRSSLIRSGVTLGTAVWDSGYEGRSECLIVVHNPEGFRIRRSARVMQLLFFRLSGDVGKKYDGIYQNENLDK